ncbi:MAG: YggT family protein [Thermoleophilaceae bacterium]|nr:YggT family protein [Thermoleophilaceae bacterium]
MITAITRLEVADYVSTLFLLYTLLIFARILMSWVPRVPDNQILRAVLAFVHDVTEPFLAVFRKILPMAQIGGAGIDFSPIVALLVLGLLRGVIVSAIAG